GLTLAGGALEATASFAPTRAVTVNAGSTIKVDSGAALTLFGILSGSGALSKTGLGTLTLSNGNSTYAGDVTVTGGSLIVARNGALGSGARTINVSGGGSGDPQLHLDGSGGAIALPSTFTYVTGNNVSATTGVFVNDAGNNSIAGAINLSTGGDTPIVVGSGSLTVSANISTAAAGLGTRSVRLRGPGDGALTGVLTDGPSKLALIQEGTGTWTLSNAANTYTGGTA